MLSTRASSQHQMPRVRSLHRSPWPCHRPRPRRRPSDDSRGARAPSAPRAPELAENGAVRERESARPRRMRALRMAAATDPCPRVRAIGERPPVPTPHVPRRRRREADIDNTHCDRKSPPCSFQSLVSMSMTIDSCDSTGLASAKLSHKQAPSAPSNPPPPIPPPGHSHAQLPT